MSVYMIIDSKVKDREKYRQYIDQVSTVVTKYGGRYHVRGEKITSFGAWKPERIIIIEFPTEDHIRRWLTSPEYRAIAPLREEGAETQAVCVNGYLKSTGDKKNWKDHFLSSGVPLEYSTTRILKQLEFTAPREYRYERIGETGLPTQFSIDIYSSYILTEPNLWLDLLVECKYRHDGTRWVFTPTEDDLHSPRYEDMFVLLDQYDISRRVSRDKVRSYARDISMCGKGIELLLDDKNPKAIEQAVHQLRYSVVSRAVDSIVHQVDELLGTPPPIFVLLPVIITTAELWRMNPSTSIEGIRKAEKLEDVAERKNVLLLHDGPDNMLISHTKNYFRVHLTAQQKMTFELHLKRTTGNPYEYFVDMFASRFPSLFLVLAYPYFETFAKELLGFISDSALLGER